MNVTGSDLLFATISICIAIIMGASMISVALFSLEQEIVTLRDEIRRLRNEIPK